MSTHLPEAVRRGLEDARVAMLRKSGRLCIHDGDDVHRVVRLWDDGFAIIADGVPHLRGLVDLYNGGTHLYQCLVVASSEEGGELWFEFKRNTAAVDHAPLDYIRDESAPIALLGR